MPRATPAGSDDSAPGFSFPAIGRKKITAAFDGGRLTSDGGVLPLAQAERAMGLCRRLAACIADPRDPVRVIHRLDDILRARVFAIACGYEDADDLDALRDDPGFRLALGKLPGSGAGLASQPTMSRWEKCADHTRTGQDDGRDDRHLLHQLPRRAGGGDAGYR